MSGSSRTAVVEVTVKFEITDNATEGEMLDAVVNAVDGLQIALVNPNGKFKRIGFNTSHVTTKGVGGHL